MPAMLRRPLSRLARLAAAFAAFAAFAAWAHADGLSVKGRVVDAAGKAVVGAKVSALYTDRKAFAFTDVVTNGNGEFEIANDKLTVSSFAMCVIDMPGFAVAGGPLAVGKSTDFKLGPPSKVTGSVVDESGKPVAGATVRVQRVRVSDIDAIELVPSLWPTSASDRLKAVTGTDGKFVIDGLPAGGTVTLKLVDERFAVATGTAVAPGPVQAIVAKAACALAGKVTYSDGKAATGWWMQAVPADNNGVYAELEPVKTGPDGTYRVGGLAPGRYAVQTVPYLQSDPAHDAWCAPGPAHVNVALGQAATVPAIILTHGATVTGIVKDAATGAPVAGASLMLGSTTFSTATTGADGRYTAHIPPGSCTIQLSGAPIGYADSWHGGSSVKLTVEEGKSYEAPPLLATKANRRIGKLLDAAGKPVAGVSFSLAPTESGHWIGPVKSDADGNFEIPNASPGKYRLNLDLSWAASTADPIVVADGDTSPITLNIRARSVQSVTGLVVNSTGQPIPGVALEFNVKTKIGKDNTYEWHNQRPVTDANGSYTITKVSPDDDIVELVSRNLGAYRYKSGGVLAKSAAGLALEPIVLVALNATVKGVVVDDNDKPVPGAWVACAGSGMPAKADANGRFVLAGVADGDVVVYAARGNAYGSKKALASATGGTSVNVPIDSIRPPSLADVENGVPMLQNLAASSIKVDDWLKRQPLSAIAASDPDLAIKSLVDLAKPVDDWTRLEFASARGRINLADGDRWGFEQVKAMPASHARGLLAAQIGLDYAATNPKAALWLCQIAAASIPTTKVTKNNIYDVASLMSLGLRLGKPEAKALEQQMRATIEDLAAAKKPAAGETDWEDSSRRQMFARAVAIGDPAQFADMMAYVPDQSRPYAGKSIIVSLARINPAAALAAFRTLKLDDNGSQAYGDAFEIVLPALYDETPTQAATIARSLSRNVTAEASALAAVADLTPLPKAATLYREAFDAPGPFGDPQIGARIAVIAGRRDKALGAELIARAIKAVGPYAERNKQQQMQYSNIPEFAFWCAQIDPGYSRVLLETHWADGSALAQSTSRNDEWSTTRWVSAVVGAMAALDVDRACEMAASVKSDRARFAASLKTGQYVLASQAARDHIKFGEWVSNGSSLPGE